MFLDILFEYAFNSEANCRIGAFLCIEPNRTGEIISLFLNPDLPT